MQAGTFSLFVLLVKGTGVCKLCFLFVLLVKGTGACKLVLSLSLFSSSELQASASWYFLCLCSARQRHTLMQAAGTFSVFVLLVKTIGPCKLVLSLSLFCSSSKPQARVSWYCLCLCSALRQNLRPVQAGNVLCLCSASLRHRLTKAGTFSVFVFLVKGTGPRKLVLSLP